MTEETFQIFAGDNRMKPTLAEQFTGIEKEPPVKDKARWIVWKTMQCPELAWFEIEREWMWRHLENEN